VVELYLGVGETVNLSVLVSQCEIRALGGEAGALGVLPSFGRDNDPPERALSVLSRRLVGVVRSLASITYRLLHNQLYHNHDHFFAATSQLNVFDILLVSS